MASNVKSKIEPFNGSGNFTNYVERMDQFFLCNEVEEEKKVALFLTLVGPDTYDTLKDLVSPEKPADMKYVDIIETLAKHLCPPKLVIAERFKFYTSNQEANEKISEFIVRLKSLASTCQFGAFLDEALRDRLVCGINRTDIQRKLLTGSELNFRAACEIALSMEMTDVQARLMLPQVNVSKVTRDNKNRPHPGRNVSLSSSNRQKEVESSFNQQPNSLECFRCGRRHESNTCPAKNWRCYNCNRTGHTARKCRIKNKVKCVAESETEDTSDEEKVISHIRELCPIRNYKTKEKHHPLYAWIDLNGERVRFEIDSGASVTIMHSSDFKRICPQLNLSTCKSGLRGVSGEKVDTLGCVEVEVELKQEKYKLPLIVTRNTMVGQPLMGRNWLDELTPGWRKGLAIAQIVESADFENQEIVRQLRKEFDLVFNEDRSQCIRGVKANVVLQENAQPVFFRPYSVPYAVKEEMEKEIKQMVEANILQPVRYSEWASPLVPVQRKDKGKLRLCVDFKVTLNQRIKTDQYPLPVLDDILYTISSGQFFTVLDLSNAYLQLEVNKESRKLLTVNTHLGLFQFTRLPFGIACAPAQFQAAMDQILKGLPMAACYIDDLIIAGRTKEESLENVKKVLRRLEEHNVRVNLTKCKFFCESVEFLGHQLDASGQRPLKQKLEAIQNASEPGDLHQLRSYLGLINYYRKFIPMMATKLKPLYDLEKKGTKFVWNQECQEAFNRSKLALMESELLVYYDPKKPIVITVDASPYGVGAVMSHMIKGEERPVQFASRTLTAAEKNYAQVQKEALALVFAVKKFHKFIYGRQFVLVSDHKPLQAILGSKCHIPTLAAARLQRWAIIMSTYQYELRYRKGSELGPADALSRLPMEEKGVAEEIYLFSEFQEPITAMDIKGKTQEDQTLSKVLKYTREGWPTKTEENVKPYYSRYLEISIDQGCLMWGNRLIVPYQLRPDVLEMLHDQHIGIVRMKMLARGEVWWPGIDADIEQQVQGCETCQRHQNRTVEVSGVSWPRTTRNFQRVHVDFLQKWGHHFLLLVDSHSKWLDVHLMKNGTTAEKTIEMLRRSFTYFGLPEELVSDNGPPFNGNEYRQFCKRNGIKCTLTPPNHPKSNGFAEKQVSTIKKGLSKTLHENRLKGKDMSLQLQLDNFLLKFRNTPSMATGCSPAEMMLRTKPRTRLTLLRPGAVETEKKMSDPRQGKKIKHFSEGQAVLVFMERNQPHWSKGRVVEIRSPVTYLVEVDGAHKLVHVDHLKASQLKEGKDAEEENRKRILTDVRIPGPSEENLGAHLPSSSSVEAQGSELVGGKEDQGVVEMGTDMKRKGESQVNVDSAGKPHKIKVRKERAVGDLDIPSNVPEEVRHSGRKVSLPKKLDIYVVPPREHY